MASMTTAAGRSLSHGRIDKRQAILAAAFTVFARRGYEQAGVQEVAEEAGVAKPTVYNHMSDKETLFRETLIETAESVAAENLAIIDRLRQPVEDLPAVLEDVAYRLLRTCCGERSRALRWLTYAQVARFPDLIEAVQSRTTSRIRDAFADRIAWLTMSGQLRPCDPTLAAEQLLALITGPLEGRGRLGTRKVTTAELRTVSDAAVVTFLRAYEADRA